MTDPFVVHRGLLFTVAYEMLSSAADAEDVLQEVWLRWDFRPAGEVRDPRAYLVRITTRLALNRLRTVARQREEYVGPWLPEPVATLPDVADDVELAEAVSTAMLLVLEALPPVERAVFVLREVFAFSHDDIAAAVDKTPAAVRQIASRARARVAEQRPRHAVSAAELARVVERFRAATETGDLQSLVDVLAPDVVLLTDGGGEVQAALRPILGREKVLRFLGGVLRESVQVRQTQLNGATAIRVDVDGHEDSMVTMEVVDGLVSRIFVVRNPAKLRAATAGPVELTRGRS